MWTNLLASVVVAAADANGVDVDGVLSSFVIFFLDLRRLRPRVGLRHTQGFILFQFIAKCCKMLCTNTPLITWTNIFFFIHHTAKFFFCLFRWQPKCTTVWWGWEDLLANRIETPGKVIVSDWMMKFTHMGKWYFLILWLIEFGFVIFQGGQTNWVTWCLLEIGT